MKRNASIILAFSVIAVVGYASIFTLPFRNSDIESPSVCSECDIQLDDLVEQKESEAQERKIYLDSLLENEQIVKEPQILPILTEEAIESTELYILSSEEETSVYEENTGDFLDDSAPFVPIPCMMDEELQEWLFEYCSEAGLDPFTIVAMCELESCCIPDIIGDSGEAYGMMQIQLRWIPDRLAEHGYTASDMLEAKPNIIIGTEILKSYIDMGNGIEWALMAYNGGISGVGSPDTVFYASWILERSTALREASEGRAFNGEA